MKYKSSVSGVKPPGASAWREGQKLARKLLGPPPTFPNLRSATEEQITANTLGTVALCAPLFNDSCNNSHVRLTTTQNNY